MMYKKTKGFSLAELLISLLIISIVLAAAIPTITKRNAMDPEKIWNWGGQNNVAYFGAGHNQSAIIGYDMMPYADYAGTDYRDKYFDPGSLIAPTGASGDLKFTTDGDRLVLVKRFLTGKDISESFVNSHISFYNIEDRTDATARELIYAGRIASDQHNLAFGIGSLLSFTGIERNKITDKTVINSNWGYNTSLGHYTLSFLKQGTLNTAVGESALTYNFDGHANTAAGAFALNQIRGGDNTAIGANAGKYIDEQGNTTSFENTLIGANTMSIGINGEKPFGNGNTAIGSTACGSMIGDGNICIGRDTGAKGNGSTLLPIKDNYSLYIGKGEIKKITLDATGVPTYTYENTGAPLIHGHTAHSTSLGGYDIYNHADVTGFDKELNVNAKYFRVKTYDGGAPILEVQALAGDGDGYANVATDPDFGRFGRLNFTLKDIGGITEGSIRMTMDGSPDPLGEEAGTANIYFYDPYKSKYLPVNFNNMLRIHAKNTYSGGSVTMEDTKITAANTMNLNGALHIDRNGDVGTGTAYSTYDDSPILSINKAGDQQELIMYDKNKKALFSLWKGDGNIHLSPYRFSVGHDSIAGFQTIAINLYATDEITLDGKKGVKLKSGNGNIKFESNNIQMTSDENDIVLPYAGLNIDGTTSIAAAIKVVNSKAEQALNTPSDARLKNISGDSTAGLKEINALEVKNYTYKKDEKKVPHVGVIAQQLQKVFPNSVFEDKDGYLKIRTEEIFYAMVNSIKELFAQVQDLTAKIVGLDKRITELEQENAALKKQNEEFEKRLSKLEAKMAK